MYIKITKHDGTFVTDVPTCEKDLAKTIDSIKNKYPKEHYHAVLVLI